MATPGWTPVDETTSKWTPVEDTKPSVGERIRQNFAEGIGITTDEGAKNFFAHPINTLINSLEAQGELAAKAKESYAKGDYKGAVMYGLNYLIPFIGQQTARAGEQLNEGDIAGGIGRTAGAAVPLLLASPEARAGAASAASKAAAPLKPAITTAARTASDIVDPEFTGMVSPRLAHAQRALGKLADALEKSQKTHTAVTAADDAVFPGANLPANPPSELLQAGALQQGSKPVVDPAAGLKTIPVRTPAPAPVAAPSKSALNTALETNLRSAVGYKPPQPNVPLRLQGPSESSAVQSYRYDPITKEMHITTKTGAGYVYGEVTPEQSQMFRDADSKGSAWKAIKDNNVLVAKVVNGKRVPVKPVISGANPADDLTDILQQSLEAAKAAKAQ